MRQESPPRRRDPESSQWSLSSLADLGALPSERHQGDAENSVLPSVQSSREGGYEGLPSPHGLHRPAPAEVSTPEAVQGWEGKRTPLSVSPPCEASSPRKEDWQPCPARVFPFHTQALSTDRGTTASSFTSSFPPQLATQPQGRGCPRKAGIPGRTEQDLCCCNSCRLPAGLARARAHCSHTLVPERGISSSRKVVPSRKAAPWLLLRQAHGPKTPGSGMPRDSAMQTHSRADQGKKCLSDGLIPSRPRNV